MSDPANPVPYRHRPIQPTYSEGSQWYNWLTEDQRFVTGRSDVAVFRLPALAQSLTLTGEVVADIFASTTGSDNDLVVKLIDQYPDDDPNPKMRGYQLIINAEIFRGRYLSGYDHPTALAPGSIHEYKFSLHDVDHVFKAGHIVMVEIQSTWFPFIARPSFGERARLGGAPLRDLTPPPLPRPPAWICALTTTTGLPVSARSCFARASASSTVKAGYPLGMGTPYFANSSLPQYSWIFDLGPNGENGDAAANPTRVLEGPLVFVETRRALGADEEPYSRTLTIPDDAIAPVSAKNSGP